MNNPEYDNKFMPKQALAPTPALYAELVADCMENLAKATVAQFPTITDSAVLHDNGCGTGAATFAIVAEVSKRSPIIKIKGTDINEQALEIYRKQTAENSWPADGTRMDSNALSFPSGTFTHSIGNALLFVLPDDGINALKEMHRTLKPGGFLAVNCWKYVPNMEPVQEAAKVTRPAGTPLPRQGMEKWTDMKFLKSTVEKGGFQKENITVFESDVYVTTSGIERYANMLWSFIGGTGASGWLKSDEDNWDKAIDVVKKELEKTPGYQMLEDKTCRLKFVANILIATK